ncbi:SEC-C domain-containing protein [Modestobacter sp. VKM Ac-2986]|nr:SEC-C domain-containing protein [Modestobacter sp. VKM Ac-2986]
MTAAPTEAPAPSPTGNGAAPVAPSSNGNGSAPAVTEVPAAPAAGNGGTTTSSARRTRRPAEAAAAPAPVDPAPVAPAPADSAPVESAPAPVAAAPTASVTAEPGTSGTGTGPDLDVKGLEPPKREQLSYSAPNLEASPKESGPAKAAKSVTVTGTKETPRNAPCPCGSGKKFKQCHGAAGA